MKEYPKLLYRPGTKTRCWGIACDTLRVGDAEQEKAAIAEGWTLRPGGEAPEPPLLKALKDSVAIEDAARRDPLDHDGDGEKGGSTKQEGPDLPALRAEYKKLAGKKAFNGWDEAELLARIGKLKEGVGA